jgi:hypothetical protein
MSSTASGIVLGFLLATAYGAAFHLIIGGRPRKILLYILAAWVGFTLGQFVGDVIGVAVFQLGAINLLSASLGAWIALILSWFLSARET